MGPVENWLMPYRLRTVRVLVRATALIVAFLAVIVVLPHGPDQPGASFLVVIGMAAIGAVCIALTPWEELFRVGRGLQWLFTWTAVDIVIISAAIVISGSASSELFYLYTLTTVFLAASFWPSGQITLMAFTGACYLGVLALTGWEITPAALFLRLAILGTLGLLASFLSRELMGQMEAHWSAKRESDRRAGLLATVAQAARSMSSLDPERVLTEVVDCAVDLGFEAANLCLYDEERQTYRVAHARGLPRAYTRGEHPLTGGMPGLVWAEQSTVVVPDYASHPQSIPLLASRGYKAVVASPVWSHDELVGALVAGTREAREVSDLEVEAFELLAAQAGRALENARRFESERRAVHRLAELDRLKRDFLSTVSHELRTPLTAIEGLGLTLEQQWKSMDEETRLDLLRRLNANASTLDEIIRTLLDFSRLETGRLEAHTQLVDVGQLVAAAIARLEALLANHTLVTRVEEDLVVNADPMLLDRVLENLLSNAAKHTPAGTPVTVSVKPSGGRVTVSVSDEGPGIPPEELEHLGDRFYRGSNTAAHQIRGMGLGLALVYEILDLHGTRLEVDSEVGRGSTFRFRLPLGARGPSSGQREAASDVAGVAKG